MDLLTAEESSSSIAKKQGFRSLKLVNYEMDQVLPEEPFGADYGKLDNGLTYYVRCNNKPKMRAALALAIKAGSVLEEEDERGVAHILEHLAFSATKKYTNHDIVKFLESIGAEFGACQNACTTPDETIYELMVPVDKPGILCEAISVLAEFSSEIRASKDDLDKERGAVMEELRGDRNASGRMQDAHLGLMMEGSKYADRSPIGLEKVIRTVSPEIVKRFYNKWYSLHNMAVIAVGDFPDTQMVVELIRTHFGKKHSTDIAPLIPNFQVPSHEEARYSCFVESEATRSAVLISYKRSRDEYKTIQDFRALLSETMFLTALNQRFFKISQRKASPFFSCSASADGLVHPVKACMMTSSCKEKCTLEAVESMLNEVARIRLHGFSDREISIGRASLLSEIESAYLERDQIQSTSSRDEYLQHFLEDEPAIGIEYEAQLYKTILPQITASEVSKYAEKLQTSCNCVIKTVEPKATVTVDDLKAVVSKINSLEEMKSILPLDDEQTPEEIVSTKPSPGNILEQFEYADIGVTELLLSNGMRVCYKCTDFLDDQVLFTGFSYGGLSEVPENEYFSCVMGFTIVNAIGIFGYKPSVLRDILAGKRAKVTPYLSHYMRSFSGDCSPSDLETALQLVYQLFTTNVEPREEEVSIVMQMAEEGVRAQERDPYNAFCNRVMELNYGSSYFSRPITLNDLQKVNPFKACEYFSNCYKDPSTFTLVIVGNIDPGTARPLILQYLGGIPKPVEPIFCFERDNLKGLPITTPQSIMREEVRSPMVEAQCAVQLSFPVELRSASMVEDIQYLGFFSKLIETKIIHSLRFKHGQIYSAGVSASLGFNKPSRVGDRRGDVAVIFWCDPDIYSMLVDLVLDEILRLQDEGPSDQDVSAVLEIEQRAYENGLQENKHWLERILRSYQSRKYFGDVGAAFKFQDEGRSKVRDSLNSLSAQLALQRLFPYPCKKQYTSVALLPLVPQSRLRQLFWFTEHDYGRDAKIIASIAALTALVFGLWRYSRSTGKS